MSIYYVTFIQAREIGIINYYREEKERNELKYRNLIDLITVIHLNMEDLYVNEIQPDLFLHIGVWG